MGIADCARDETVREASSSCCLSVTSGVAVIRCWLTEGMRDNWEQYGEGTKGDLDQQVEGMTGKEDQSADGSQRLPFHDLDSSILDRAEDHPKARECCLPWADMRRVGGVVEAAACCFWDFRALPRATSRACQWIYRPMACLTSI